MPEQDVPGHIPADTGKPARRLLLVSTNYAPERAGIGPYAAQTAEHLAARPGWEVHVLAGMPHYPAWRTDPEYRGVWRAAEERAGVRVHRRRHTVPPRQTALRRALYEASILAHGTLAPPRTGRPDVVLAQLPSLAGGVLAARTAHRHRVPFVPVVQDLMGAAARQSGISGGGKAAALAASAERYVLGRATLVGVIHESFVDKVAAMGVPRSRIRLVPNWSHVRRPSAPRAETRARLGWDAGTTVVLHAGNMGLKQGLEVLIGTARLDPGIRVVLMGDGNQRRKLAELAAGLPNVELLPPADEADFTDVLAAADVLAVTQRASVQDMSVPSKLTSYFATGRPVVGSVADGGGTAGELRRSGAAVLVPPEDPAALRAAVTSLAGDPVAADRLGAGGPRYVEEHLSREAGLARITALVDEALESTAARRAGAGTGAGAGAGGGGGTRADGPAHTGGRTHTGVRGGAGAGERRDTTQD
ncbi:glycosyltransferase family 4 protein [Streptomyces sp. NPDC054796]